MLVIAKKCSFWICRERGFPRARKAKKHGDIARFPHVRRAVHRHHFLLRQNIVEISENGFFHFPSVFSATNQNNLACKITCNHRFTAAAMARGVCLERRHVHNRHFRIKGGQFIQSWTNKQIADEQGMPCHLGVNTGTNAMGRVSTTVKILRKQLFSHRMLFKIGQQRVKVSWCHCSVVFPPHGIICEYVLDNKLIFWGTASKNAGVHTQRPPFHQHGLTTLE